MSFRIAAATSDGINIDLHFGHADTLYIYEVHDDGSYKLDDRINAPGKMQDCENGCGGGCHGGGGGFSIDTSFLKGVKYVLAAKIGNGIEKSLLRNNITTPEHPLGVYHPHAGYHHIKKENIGLIEVMGCAILPARLKDEMARLKEAVLEGRDYRKDETLEKHADWMDAIRSRYEELNADNIDRILRDEIGAVFSKVLENAGVYKRDEKGQKAFLRFVDSVNRQDPDLMMSTCRE